MTKHLKKVLALLLAIVLCLGTVPFPAFAVGVLPDDDFSSEVTIEPEEPDIFSSPAPESSSSPRGSPAPTESSAAPENVSSSAEPANKPDEETDELSPGSELDIYQVWPAMRKAQARAAAGVGTSGTLYVGDYCLPGGVGTPPTLGERIGPTPVETMKFGSNNVAAYCLEHAKESGDGMGYTWMDLTTNNQENLHNRGLTDREIARLGYKSMPTANCSALTMRLTDAGVAVRGVPGFFCTKAGWWSLVHQRSGILIPVRDISGQIQGMQVRLDNTEKRKFRWISSSGLTAGTQCPAWTHLAGEPSTRIVLTEGPMKADIIHALTGQTVLAVPGVNALTKLEESLSLLRKQGLREIKTAFDMDYCTNWYVQRSYDELLALLGRMGFRYGTYIWDPRYKGLDDFIWAQLQKGTVKVS